MKKYKAAAVIMIIHGGFMEIGGVLGMIPALLPAGIMDGVLSGSALVLLLMQYFGDRKITE